MRSNEINVGLYLKYRSPTLSIVNDVIRDEDASENYETIIGILGAGVIAAIIAFFVVQKKKIKS